MRDLGRTQHASTEQLSALLDDRSEPDEQAFVDGHVRTCVVCASELADLRSVRAMLRAMPVYLPSRSFTIPIREPAAVPVAATAVAPASSSMLRVFPRSRLAPFTRALSALAAVLCVVLFSADAMQTGLQSTVPLQDGAGAMFITASRPPTDSPGARSVAETEAATQEVAPADSAIGRPAAAPAAASAAKPSESGTGVAITFATATMASQIVYPPRAAAEAPATPAPEEAPSGPAPAAPAPRPPAQAPAGEPQSKSIAQPPQAQGTVVAFTATPPASVPTSAAASDAAAVRAPAPPPAGERIQPAGPRTETRGMTPLRVASSVFAAIAAILLVTSLVLGRAEQGRQRTDTGGSGQ